MRHLLTFSKVCLLGLVPCLAFYGHPQQTLPEPVTIVVRHEECTTCQALTVDSGTVRIPVHLQPIFIDNQLKYRRRWELERSRDQHLAFYTRAQYAVTELKVSSQAVFDSLFAVPDRTITLYPGGSPVSYPWDFDRHYRLTGYVSAIEGKYPVFKIQQAVLVRTAK